MEIFYSSCFLRQIKKLTPEEKLLLSKFEINFRRNPFNPKLKTHKLSGKLKGFWACSLNYKTRVVFELRRDGAIVLIDIGSHQIYR